MRTSELGPFRVPGFKPKPNFEGVLTLIHPVVAPLVIILAGICLALIFSRP